MTKLFALGAVGAGGYAAVRAMRRAAARKHQREAIESFDYGDLDEPVVVAEEVVIVTEAGPYEVEMELVPGQSAGQAQTSSEGTTDGGSASQMPGRGAGPR